MYQTESNKKSIITPIFMLIITLIVIAIIILLLLTTKFYKINGTSMYPTLKEGEMVTCLKTSNIKRGDIIAFYKNNNFMIKRVIALPGETIDISESGSVKINGTSISEPYISSSTLGNPDVKFPYNVPNNFYFVLGDNREDSLDSRHYTIGTIPKTEIICKVTHHIWPFEAIE